jgi:Ras-related protein Rab-23
MNNYSLDNAAMDNKEVEALATKLNMKLFRTCVKDDLNVAEIFTALAQQYIEAAELGEQDEPQQFTEAPKEEAKTFKLEAESSKKKKKKRGICS